MINLSKLSVFSEANTAGQGAQSASHLDGPLLLGTGRRLARSARFV
jgi:hypothetical protein